MSDRIEKSCSMSCPATCFWKGWPLDTP